MRYKLLAIALLFTLCSCANPLIGRHVDNEDPEWCHVDAFPGSCKIPIGAFQFDYETKFDSVSGEYSIQGYATAISVRSIQGVSIHDSNTYFILAKGGVITDVIYYNWGGDLKNKNKFSVKFKSSPFDSMTIGYDLIVIR
jgi:hypothetical protein